MAVSQKAKGPAEAATSPSHGSANPEKDMDMNTHINSTNVAATASTSLDPVVAAGLGYAAAERLYQELERKERAAKASGKNSAVIYYDHASHGVYDAMCAVRDTIPHHKASTYAGALVQLNHALLRLDFLLDSLPEGAATFEIRRHSRCIVKCLFSAVEVIENQSGAKLEDVLHPDHCNRHQNPWVPVEERCDELRAEGGAT